LFTGSRDNAGVEKAKWGHVTWVCKGSQFVVLSLCVLLKRFLLFWMSDLVAHTQ